MCVESSVFHKRITIRHSTPAYINALMRGNEKQTRPVVSNAILDETSSPNQDNVRRARHSVAPPRLKASELVVLLSARLQIIR